jgi:bacteriorhodopsin
MLVTTGTICFIESMRSDDPMIRHIMNLEVCISIIAAYFYSQFLEKLSKYKNSINYKEINMTRYIDWFMSTPLMLLVLCLILSYNNKNPLRLNIYLSILILNFGMLLSGYMGETGKISKDQGLIFGFVFFFVLFGYIYINFVKPNPIFDNKLIFGVFFVLWTIYGLVYKKDEETKNITFNILDLSAKGLVGIFFWIYLTKVIIIG